MTDTETEVRESFFEQARYCRDMAAPFTAELCDLLGERLSRDTAIGARALGWPGDPEPVHDALALRLVAGLHALAERGIAPAWTSVYPPALAVDRTTLGAMLDDIIVRFEKELMPWLDLPPQTNEVGRSAVLMSGLLTLAADHGLPFSLFELGSSGGLNLMLDRYTYTLGVTEAGARDSAVRLEPAWTGPSPPRAKVRVIARRGVDQAPVDIGTPAGRERLLAYVWADQLERVRRIRYALKIAASDPPRVDKMDAAEWIEKTLTPVPSAGVHRVLMHSVVFQYFSDDVKRRVTAQAEAVGARAATDAPFSWMRMEQGGDGKFTLCVRTWPGGDDRMLAKVHPHGAKVEWLSET
ncbi:MAG: DUF2332 family protein [Proteobacteria bacterium]|nr:DUF2332 family protein [Pseudomonadota bacterium]